MKNDITVTHMVVDAGSGPVQPAWIAIMAQIHFARNQKTDTALVGIFS